MGYDSFSRKLDGVEDFSLDQTEEPKLKMKIKSANSNSPDTQFDDKESIDGWKIVPVG